MTILHPNHNLQKLEAEHVQLEQSILQILQQSTNADDAELRNQLLHTPAQLWPESLSRYCPSFLAAPKRRLEKVQAAISQIKLGFYGICADCEAQIEPERLELDPASQRCKACDQKALEQAPELRH
jgi:RNA polymerase-binding transcription factor DksA